MKVTAMDREEIAEVLRSLREDIERTETMIDSDMQRDLRLDHLEAALACLMVALLSHEDAT